MFRRVKVAVFVDGCFWHGCPEHGTWPRKHPDYWRAKIEGNAARDQQTDEALVKAGWLAVRVWEHEAAGRGSACGGARERSPDVGLSVAPKTVGAHCLLFGHDPYSPDRVVRRDMRPRLHGNKCWAARDSCAEREFG